MRCQICRCSTVSFDFIGAFHKSSAVATGCRSTTSMRSPVWRFLNAAEASVWFGSLRKVTRIPNLSLPVTHGDLGTQDVVESDNGEWLAIGLIGQEQRLGR